MGQSRAAPFRQVFNAHVDAGGGRMFKSKFNPDGSMYQLDGGAVIKMLLAHSTYLKELGVVDKGQLGGKEDLVVVAALLTATQVRVSSIMSCWLAVTMVLFIRRVVLLWLMVVIVTSEI